VRRENQVPRDLRGRPRVGPVLEDVECVPEAAMARSGRVNRWVYRIVIRRPPGGPHHQTVRTPARWTCICGRSGSQTEKATSPESRGWPELKCINCTLGCGTVTSFGSLKVRLEHGSLNSGALASTNEARRHKYSSSGVGARRGWNRPLDSAADDGVTVPQTTSTGNSRPALSPSLWRPSRSGSALSSARVRRSSWFSSRWQSRDRVRQAGASPSPR